MANDNQTTDTPKTSDLKTGDVIRFANGGRVEIHFIDLGWIYFATWYPDDDEPFLRRMTADNFEAALRFTEKETEAVDDLGCAR